MSLKVKAIYTAGSKALLIIVNFFSQLLITPLIVSGLGQHLFGIYSLLNKTEGYLAFVDLRSSAVLRYKLNLLQSSNDQKEKREYVGAAFILSVLTFPLIFLVGCIIAWFFPMIFKVPTEFEKVSQISILILSGFLGLKSFLGFPEAILRGNNLEYKGFYIDPMRVILFGILVYFSIYIESGLLGIFISMIISYIIAFLIKLYIQIKNSPGYFPLFPAKSKINEFFNNGSWYLASSFSLQILNSFDLILIGILMEPKSVAVYALTKAVLFRVGESILALTGSLSAGLGQLIGDNDQIKINQIRQALVRLCFVAGLFLFSYFLLFNKSFVSLWVGNENFAGHKVNLVLCITMVLLLMINSEELFINNNLNFKLKSRVILYSSIISILSALVLYFFFDLLGIAVGVLLGKLFQLVLYAKTNNRSFNSSFFTFLNLDWFIAFVLVFFVGSSIGILYFINIDDLINDWYFLILYSLIFCVLFFLLTWRFVLVKNEKELIASQVKGVLKI